MDTHILFTFELRTSNSDGKIISSNGYRDGLRLNFKLCVSQRLYNCKKLLYRAVRDEKCFAYFEKVFCSRR